MSVTIKDVAKKAGVSLSTVSLVINKKSHIAPETRKKVEDAIAELNYYPSRTARVLASKKTSNLGFILSEDHFSRAEPFYTKVFLGAEFEARQFHYYILLTTVPKNFREGSHIPRFLLERNVDGVIMAGHVPQALVDYVQNLELPIIFIDYSPGRGKFTSVFMDNEGGAFEAVKHLIELGHKKIAFLGGDKSHPSMVGRFQGYQRALAEHNLPLVPNLIENEDPETTVESGCRAAARLFKRGVQPTAIFACNDAVATGCMKYLKESNFRIPEDISIVGFDDIEQDVLLDPPLTTVRVHKEEMGAVALRRMVEILEKKNSLTGQVLVPVELAVRRSTARAAGAN